MITINTNLITIKIERINWKIKVIQMFQIKIFLIKIIRKFKEFKIKNVKYAFRHLLKHITKIRTRND